MFVKHGCPRRHQISTMVKIAKSYILTPTHPQGYVMSVKCEQPLDELTVQVWLLYDHPNFKYCTLFLSGTELRTNRQTDGRTDDPNPRCPRRTFQAGGIKTNYDPLCMNKYRDWVKTLCSWISFLGLKSTLFSEYVWTNYNLQNRIECINRWSIMNFNRSPITSNAPFGT